MTYTREDATIAEYEQDEITLWDRWAIQHASRYLRLYHFCHC